MVAWIDPNEPERVVLLQEMKTTTPVARAPRLAEWMPWRGPGVHQRSRSIRWTDIGSSNLRR